MPLKRAPEDHPGFPVRRCEGDDHEVQSCESILVLPEAFANQPFQAVAPVRPADALLRDREPEARRPGAPGSGQNREISVGRANRIFEYSPEVALRAEPPVAAERTVEIQGQTLKQSSAPGPWPSVP